MLSNATAGLCFYGLALVSVVAFLYVLARQRTVASWPVASGTIVSSTVESGTDGDTYPRVKYTYVADGKEFTNDRIYPSGQLSTTGSHAQRLVEKYAPGRKVQVRYNPADPTRSALEAAMPALVPVMLIMAVVMFTFLGSLIRG
jgi:hypothetical protein